LEIVGHGLIAVPRSPGEIGEPSTSIGVMMVILLGGRFGGEAAEAV